MSPRSRRRISVRDRFGLRDLLAETSLGIGARPGRLILTALGTVLGIASVVVTIGLADTAAGQIARQFDQVANLSGVATPRTQQGATGSFVVNPLPWDSADRALRLAGIDEAGLIAAVDIDNASVTTVPINDPSQPATLPPAVVAADAGLLDAVGGHVVTGRFFDAGHSQREDRVVVLGARAAQRLGVGRVDSQPSLFIDERPYTIVGIIDDVARRGDLLDAVILPMGTARADFAVSSPDELHLRIAVGAGPVVAEQLPIALAPNDPQTMAVSVPVTASATQANVQADIDTIFLALAGVALLIGAVGIANVTLLSVRERIGEIGLRRALGARKKDIGAQFIMESATIGLLGGIIGATLGVAVVVVVSTVQDWIPLVNVGLVGVSALGGGLVGLLAGVYPAMKAASIEPVAALRQGL